MRVDTGHGDVERTWLGTRLRPKSFADAPSDGFPVINQLKLPFGLKDMRLVVKPAFKEQFGFYRPGSVVAIAAALLDFVVWFFNPGNSYDTYQIAEKRFRILFTAD